MLISAGNVWILVLNLHLDLKELNVNTEYNILIRASIYLQKQRSQPTAKEPRTTRQIKKSN